MNRRSFLSVLGLTAATAVLDPEKLLWVPGEKTIFIPPVRNQFITTQMICDEALRQLQKRFTFERFVKTPYEGWEDSGFKVGDTIAWATLQSPHV